MKQRGWDAAAIVARSAVQFAMRDKGAAKGRLYSEIEDLANKGTLHPITRDWSHDIRELAMTRPIQTSKPPLQSQKT